eukprot:609975-Amphidinium_carterae.1
MRVGGRDNECLAHGQARNNFHLQDSFERVGENATEGGVAGMRMQSTCLAAAKQLFPTQSSTCVQQENASHYST